MTKPIFENESEMNEFIDQCIPGVGVLFKDSIQFLIRDKGYIRKSIIEEVEEMYSRYNPNKDEYDIDHILINKQHEAIQHLKKQLEEK